MAPKGKTYCLTEAGFNALLDGTAPADRERIRQIFLVYQPRRIAGKPELAREVAVLKEQPGWELATDEAAIERIRQADIDLNGGKRYGRYKGDGGVQTLLKALRRARGADTNRTKSK
jgi:hypothetical protein